MSTQYLEMFKFTDNCLVNSKEVKIHETDCAKAIVETQTRLGAKVIVEAFNNIVYSSHYKN